MHGTYKYNIAIKLNTDEHEAFQYEWYLHDRIMKEEEKDCLVSCMDNMYLKSSTGWYSYCSFYNGVQINHRVRITNKI